MEVKLYCDCHCQCPRGDMVHFNQKAKWKVLYQRSLPALIMNCCFFYTLFYNVAIKQTLKVGFLQKLHLKKVKKVQADNSPVRWRDNKTISD